MRVSSPPVSDMAMRSRAIEIARKVLREDVPEFLIIGFRIQYFLLFPLLRMEIAGLLVSSAPLRNTQAEAGGRT